MSLGVSHATGYWQVGDATQQNGQFKHYSNAIKNRLCTRLVVNLKPYDIVPIHNYAFAQSFGDAAGTKKAVAERGWNPLNMGALTHPDISATRIDSDDEDNNNHNTDAKEYDLGPYSQQSQVSAVSQLTQRSAASHIAHKKLSRADLVVISQGTDVYNGFNLTGDITSQVFDKCQQQNNRLSGQRSALKKSREDQHRLGLSQITIVGKISSGALNKEGVILPNHPAAIQLILSRSQQNVEKKKLQAVSHQEKAYKLHQTGRESLLKWEASLVENSNIYLTSDNYKHTLCFKMIGRCKEDRDTIVTKVSKRKELWKDKWKDEPNPLQPV
jgi:hypothetical protein